VHVRIKKTRTQTIDPAHKWTYLKATRKEVTFPRQASSTGSASACDACKQQVRVSDVAQTDIHTYIHTYIHREMGSTAQDYIPAKPALPVNPFSLRKTRCVRSLPSQPPLLVTALAFSALAASAFRAALKQLFPPLPPPTHTHTSTHRQRWRERD
jgi:hypothetical protein